MNLKFMFIFFAIILMIPIAYAGWTAKISGFNINLYENLNLTFVLPYLYSDAGGQVFFNESKLNNTIDLRASAGNTDYTYVQNRSDGDCPNGNAFGLFQNGTFKCRSDLNTGGGGHTGVYPLYNDTSYMYFNDTTFLRSNGSNAEDLVNMSNSDVYINMLFMLKDSDQANHMDGSICQFMDESNGYGKISCEGLGIDNYQDGKWCSVYNDGINDFLNCEEDNPLLLIGNLSENMSKYVTYDNTTGNINLSKHNITVSSIIINGSVIFYGNPDEDGGGNGYIYYSIDDDGGFITLGDLNKLRVPRLANCDTIDTDGTGRLSCGTDEGGSGSFLNGTDIELSLLYPHDRGLPIQNVIAYYPFDNNNTVDKSGNGYNLVRFNTSYYMNGRFGDAINLSGSDSKLYNTDFTCSAKYGTIALWLYVQSPRTDLEGNYIWSCGSNFYLYQDELNPTMFIGSVGGEMISGGSSFNITLSDLAWNHFVMTWDNRTESAAIYINGVNIYSWGYTGTIDDSDLYIGSTASNYAFGGVYDEVIYLNESVDDDSMKYLFEKNVELIYDWDTYDNNNGGTADSINITNTNTTELIFEHGNLTFNRSKTTTFQLSVTNSTYAATCGGTDYFTGQLSSYYLNTSTAYWSGTMNGNATLAANWAMNNATAWDSANMSLIINWSINNQSQDFIWDANNQSVMAQRMAQNKTEIQGTIATNISNLIINKTFPTLANLSNLNILNLTVNAPFHATNITTDSGVTINSGINMSGYNMTQINCIFFTNGGKICVGSN